MRRKLRRRGMTFIELMISSGLFVLVGIFVMQVTLLIARQTRRSLTSVPAQATAFRTIERIRGQLLMASVGTVAQGADENQILFSTPMGGAGVTNSITFEPDENRLLIDPNTAVSGNERPWRTDRISNVTFAPLADGKTVRVVVTAASRDLRNQVVPLTFTETLTIRN